jgi:hypothetical protein
LYSVTAVLAIVAVAMSWRRWENEFGVDDLKQ